jgi:hypothetical protein
MVASIADLWNLTPKQAYNISNQQLVKAGQGILLSVTVLSGTAIGGTVNDAASIASVAAGNQIAAIPAGATSLNTPLVLNFPFTNGLVITPPAGGTVSVAYG